MSNTAPQPADRGGQRPRRGVDRITGRHVIARLAAPEHDHAVRAVADLLSGEQSAVDEIVDDALSDPERLEALERIGSYDEVRSPTLDRVAALTAEALGTQMAAVSIVYPDRQVLAGCNASDEQMPRVRPLEMSICKFTVASREPLVVDDTRAHPLLADHPAVRDGGVLAYAGIPLIDGAGHVAGTLCTWDTRPRQWSSGQVQILNDLAAVARQRLLADPGNE
ncbi:GAF domain-containing protein [Mycobacterium sp. CVI_P3]|uniref:GAF domain-containing protein n=1 Tax=Mycobacterium pinniadriaticum TaxID=2994102 RepID=A0ABT3S8T7_9MYCO|nr:GAF domain-containing protein [Mycobacterium pinniadriaticum]MCX2928783.1 GAF domain-containing protein [Mycobacterium pinniadriaticum]MCX2935350.1 GAF domain-containing protein [Mycobacterium pinniadriaticum]